MLPDFTPLRLQKQQVFQKKLNKTLLERQMVHK